MPDDARLGERVRAVEVSLKDHIRACERKHEKAFRAQIVVLAAVLGLLARVFGLV